MLLPTYDLPIAVSCLLAAEQVPACRPAAALPGPPRDSVSVMVAQAPWTLEAHYTRGEQANSQSAFQITRLGS